MKTIIVSIIVLTVLIGAGFFLFLGETPLAEISQSERCSVMCHRRDIHSLENLKGKSKDEIRAILGDPQNIDDESDIWVWINQWDHYKASGLALDWKTMVANSPGDGLWIKFKSDRCEVNFPYSFSADDPLDSH